MLEVGSRNEVALAVMATAAARRPPDRRWRWAACSATGVATTTATSRLTSALSRAVNASTAAVAARGGRRGISARASSAKAPRRLASAAAAMIAARVANGPRVARAAGGIESGRSQADTATRMAAAAHRERRTGSPGDAILADVLVFLGVNDRIPPRYPVKSQGTDDAGGWAARDRMLHDYVRL